MTFHVDIGNADVRLSELVATAKRGEEVLLTEFGVPVARLVRIVDEPAIDDAEIVARRDAEIVARRMRTLGMYSHLAGDDMPLVRDMKPIEAEFEERFARKFGTAE